MFEFITNLISKPENSGKEEALEIAESLQGLEVKVEIKEESPVHIKSKAEIFSEKIDRIANEELRKEAEKALYDALQVYVYGDEKAVQINKAKSDERLIGNLFLGGTYFEIEGVVVTEGDVIKEILKNEYPLIGYELKEHPLHANLGCGKVKFETFYVNDVVNKMLEGAGY